MTVWSAISNATTSLGDLKATVTGASGRARSSASLPSGKSYCEATVNATGGTGFGVGVANTSETNYVGGTANSIGTLQDGNIYTNNSYVTSSKVSAGSPVALAVNDVVQIAVDLPNNKIWIAVNGGTWNTYLTGDPATGAGSMDLSTVTGTKYLYFEGDLSGPAVTVNFGASAFAYTPPSGFSGWDSAGVTVALTGVSATGSAGTLVASRAFTLSGQVATASPGSVAQARSLQLAGLPTTGARGSLGVSRVQAMSGLALTPSVGALTYGVPLTGVSATSALGTLTPSRSVALNGQSATGAVGAITAGSVVSAALTGVSATAALGTLSPDRSKTLTGAAATTALGSASMSLSAPLSGVAAASALGTITASISGGTITVTLSGVAASTGVGTLSASQAIYAAPLSGLVVSASALSGQGLYAYPLAGRVVNS